MSAERLKGWKEVPRGGAILEPGCYERNNTGTWRTYVPVVFSDKAREKEADRKACIQCLQCWILCPDSAIPVKEGKDDKGKVTQMRQHTDLMHCKGCGICAAICPVQCIDMKLESEIKPGEPKG